MEDRYPLAEEGGRAPRSRRDVAIVIAAPRRRGPATFAILLLAAVLATMILARGTGYVYGDPPARPAIPPVEAPSSVAAGRRVEGKLQADNRRLKAALAHISPTGTYIVVDQTQNRLYIMNGAQAVRTAVCSAGSGMVLRDAGGTRKWVFDTPRGVFKVTNRITDPIWRKPDWEFVQEGKLLPTNPADRFESGTLGRYALYLQDGYMIHGTLYTRLLGRSVTHGCIRLGPDDLQAVWDAAPLGTPVYIF